MKLCNGISYFSDKFWVFMVHLFMLGDVFLNGNYDSTLSPTILAIAVLGLDIGFFMVMSTLKQSTYTVDMLLLLIINMSNIFQSCFGGVSFDYKHYIMGIAAMVCCHLGFRLTQNGIFIEENKKYFYIATAVIILLIIFCTGSRSMWIDLGFITIQPSEFLKPVFVILCATSLQKQLTKTKVLCFKIVPDNYFVLCTTLFIFALQWWAKDLGSLPTFALVALFSLITKMCYPKAKFSKKKVVTLCICGAALAVTAGIFAPAYVKERLSSDIWSDPTGSGYQQCKALIAIAEGSWFGKGAGYGTLHKVAASDTDIVFSCICEEWGLLMALFAVGVLVLMIATSLINMPRSYFHGTLAIGVAAVFIAQMSLNIFGSCNLIPFTGVTIPFISKGGSSMLSCGLLVGFLKASQTPANKAAVDMPFIPKKKGGKHIEKSEKMQ